MTRGLAAAAAAVLFAGPAHAQRGPCLPHDQAAEQLMQRHAERQVGIGMVDGGATIAELYVSENGSWTILFTGTRGLSCVAASGEGWERMPLKPGESS